MTSPAKNEIEKLLIKAQAGAMDSEAFMKELMKAEIFMPIRDKYEIGGLQTTTKTKPLTLKDESGVEVLILFTSPDRAKSFVSEYPGYGGGLLAEFKWIVDKMGAGYAISINPDHELGLDLEVNMIEQLTTH